ncbi:flagellar hook capping FlgD N-terminal domain-containing protein [Bacillus sp. B15-48]|uniref:flagellar hook capping FlgD N-terminal domain-containing protein n=1 Tax=Bacillus sp. B15-48 TaxID=1548601 RepID=UPI0019401AB5|nr:flagellar hook capping FlgD N-terminal domain-containing protein [Bacillus sp. B15-48]
MTTIQPIQAYSTKQTTSQLPSKELGKEQFLKVLVAQLQHQDMTQPMNDGEMITQMAQLSVLEQLSNLNSSISSFVLAANEKDLSQYSGMLEKQVTWVDPLTNQSETGVISGISLKNNQVYFKIDDQEILSSAIISVELNQE